MKPTSHDPSRFTAAAFAAMVLAAACSSSSNTGSGFGDPPPAGDDAGDDGPGYTLGGGSSGGSAADASGSSSGSAAPHDAGKDAAKPAPCRGSPASCTSRGTETACDALGCSWAGMCVGTALPCAGLDQSKCGIQQNCTYDSATGTCSGTVFACNVLAAAYGCTTQQGCTWQMGCGGSPSVACAGFGDSSSCTGAGCTWN